MANKIGKSLPTVVDVSAASTSVSAEDARNGDQVYHVDRGGSGAATINLPSAEPGMRIGVARLNATAGDDVTVSAADGDTIRGSNAGKAITNDTDAVSSGTLYLIAKDETEWVIDDPVPADEANWAVDNS